jgi:uncharacterized protein YndB with AHSA1/START domain
MTESKAKKRTSKQLEFEVPGTPEQVWQAIATGPGISSWLFPTTVEERNGGAIKFEIGPGMTSSGSVTAWDPPSKFAYEETNWSEGAPPLATEFVIEARSGGTCVVRLVHSLFTEKEDWDDELGSFEAGWNAFFKVLRLYLRHFPGQQAVCFRVFGPTSRSDAEAWATLKSALRFERATPGQRWTTSGTDAPPCSGTIAHLDEDAEVRELIAVLDGPTPGITLLGVATWNQKVHVTISFYLFGERAAAVASREEAAWTRWQEQRFANG